jgi:hypothetical protein
MGRKKKSIILSQGAVPPGFWYGSMLLGMQPILKSFSFASQPRLPEGFINAFMALLNLFAKGTTCK